MIDIETTLPLSSLDPCPWNPKKPISGTYKSGLRSSLEYFNNCDRLRVWPIPGKKNRYYVLDGNQRLGLIREIEEEKFISEYLGISIGEDGRADPKLIREARAKPENEKLFQRAYSHAMGASVDVLIMSRLDQEDAILFNATFNRNHAVADEAKIVNSVELIRSKNQELIKRLARPDRGLVNPLPPPPTPFAGSKLTEEVSKPFVPADEAEAKYGPPPPLPAKESVAKPPPSLIPMVLSLTPEGYHDITSSCLKSSSRLYRQSQILAALNQLDAACVAQDETYDIDSITIEIALLTLNRHTEIISKK